MIETVWNIGRESKSFGMGQQRCGQSLSVLQQLVVVYIKPDTVISFFINNAGPFGLLHVATYSVRVTGAPGRLKMRDMKIRDGQKCRT